MSASRTRLVHRGFDLRLDNGFAAEEARAVVDRVLSTGGDRVSLVMDRVVNGVRSTPRLFVKAEFRRPGQPLGKRIRPSRAIAEGRGYRAFAAAGLPTPRLFAYGEQSRLRPRAGAVVVTEKIRGLDAARLFRRRTDAETGRRVARLLASIHAAGLVHGDAVLRNFVLVPAREYVLDLPGWERWSADGAERDAGLLIGSAMKLGADSAHVAAFLDAYAAAAPGLADGWRDRVVRAAEEYRDHLLERDATRPARRAKKSASPLRAGERAAEREPGGKGARP